MFEYLIRRLLWSVVMLILVVAVVFVIFFVLPGGQGRREEGRASGVAVLMAGRNPRPELVRSIERRLGLDRPVYEQFGRYIWNAFQGDLGYSYHSNEDVTAIVVRRIPPTAGMALGASVLWLVFGIALGVISALRRRTLLDRTTMFFALVGVSMPVFFLGLVAVFFFDGQLGIYETGDYEPLTQNPVQWLRAMWLPWIVLALLYIAVYSRVVRGNVLEVSGEDFVRTARAKGLRERSVVRHQLRAALTPVVTMYGLDLGILLGGAIITESIFNIPGIGTLTVNAIQDANLPVILGTTIVGAAFIVVANLVVDIVYAFLDPRVTYS